MSSHSASVQARLIGVTIMLVASITLAAVGLHGWQTHLSARDANQRRLTGLLEVGVVELVASADSVDLESAPQAFRTQFDRWASAVTRQPLVLAAGLRDGEGRVVQVWPPQTEFELFCAGLAPGQRQTARRQADWDGRPVDVDVAVGVLDVGGGSPWGDLVLVAASPKLASAWNLWLLTFALPLGGVALLGFAIGLRWVRQRVGAPLRALPRRPEEEDEAWLSRLPTERPDEIGSIARSTGDLITELSDARARLDHLERTVDSRVAERTRQIVSMLKDAEQKAWVDPLTGLGNRRLLDDRVETVFDMQRAAGAELCIAMFDLDHFKAHNDSQGHAAGDDLLRFFGQLLRGCLRETDIGIRYAGDEFVVLLLSVPSEDALNVATRVVRLFAQHTSTLPTQPQPTVSAGIASLRLSGAGSGAELLQRADEALYLAKGRGKNQACLWRPSTVPAAPAARPPIRR